MKKIFKYLIVVIFFLTLTTPALAETISLPKPDDNQPVIVDLLFFYSETCGHCYKEAQFLKTLPEKYPYLNVISYSIFEKENVERLKYYYNEYNVPEYYYGNTPATFIDDKYFIGFDPETDSDKITAQIEKTYQKLYYQTDSSTDNNNSSDTTEPTDNNIKETKTVTLPIIGEIKPENYSPLALAIIFGGLDGFNACAMIALAFLLTVLVSTGVRKKVILIGGTFIFVSGFVYFIFISAWLNLFLAVQHIQLITTIVSIIVIIFAAFILKDYANDIICKLCQTTPAGRTFWQKFEQFLFLRLQKLTDSNISTPLLLLGVSFVAAGINIVELACSFGFPLAFTKLLAGMGLSTVSYYFYLLIYILFYMLDDIIVFMIAVFTLKVTDVSDKYLKYIKLISGILLLIMGIVLLVKPELLAFGA